MMGDNLKKRDGEDTSPITFRQNLNKNEEPNHVARHTTPRLLLDDRRNTYRRPDFPDFLQNYIWQDHDMAPRFPVLKEFLQFWEQNLDGELHSVRVASAELIRPAEFRLVDTEIRLH